ncbi:MAG TPA: Fe-S cluster assembly protein SufD, partial [Candidatus Angelobacter sp.]|nr:Fe-S cluster assembly protein SufD [Candidatus Angelobacter sp.]
MITATQAPEKYLEAFEHLKGRLGAQPRWLQSLRQEALARFSETGFPTTHDEDWRFTNVAPVSNTQFELAGAENVTKQQLEPFAVTEFATRLVFINGLFAGKLSTLAPMPAGVKAGSLAAQLKSDPANVEPH